MTTGRINLVSIVQTGEPRGGRRRGLSAPHLVSKHACVSRRGPRRRSLRPRPTGPRRARWGWAAAPVRARAFLLQRQRAAAPLRCREFFCRLVLREKERALGRVSSFEVGSSSENTREEAGRPDARESAALGRGGSAARARGGRALPEASLESVLGGEGRGAQPRTERPAEGARRAGESTRRMRAAFGAELWDRPGQAQALYWGRTGFCEWVECASGGRREARRGSARDAQRVTMQTSARALG